MPNRQKPLWVRVSSFVTRSLNRIENALTKRQLIRIRHKYELTDLPNVSQIVDCCLYLEEVEV